MIVNEWFRLPPSDHMSMERLEVAAMATTVLRKAAEATALRKSNVVSEAIEGMSGLVSLPCAIVPENVRQKIGMSEQGRIVVVDGVITTNAVRVAGMFEVSSVDTLRPLAGGFTDAPAQNAVLISLHRRNSRGIGEAWAMSRDEPEDFETDPPILQQPYPYVMSPKQSLTVATASMYFGVR